ncbi:hypothetical protein CUJ86_06010 [Methanofollis fontis]|uniref:Uncharacterized protein n=1 Tax=Methanofollis fontis TaxID=2052832 RepID=A0A483CP60_9EURY|nr:hypothetical protein CUJ86_06010 [Methanofollis fontis]
MEIMEIINEILSRSRYLGSFPYFEMSRVAGSRDGSVGVFVDSSKSSVILFSGGEPTGAIFRDEKGALFGDSAVLKITDNDEYDLYGVDRRAVDIVVSHCRVFNKGHFPHQLPADIPEIGEKRKSPGVLSIDIVRDDRPQSGVRVSMRKGRHVIASDVTTGDGKVSFRLLNGHYDVLMIDRAREVYTFLVDFNGKKSELVIDLGGLADE